MRIKLFINNRYWYSFYAPEKRPKYRIPWCKPLELWGRIVEKEGFSEIIIKNFIFEFDKMINKDTAKYLLVDIVN